MEILLALVVTILVTSCAQPAVAQSNGPVLSVGSCREFQDAISTKSEGIVLVSIARNIKCYESEWVGVVDIVSRVEIVGARQDHGVTFIDFGGAFEVLHIADGASLRFESLIIFHDSVGVLGPLSHTPFINGDPGARFTTAGVLLNYRKCPRRPAADISTSPTHARIDRARGVTRTDPTPTTGPQFSPHSFVQESVTTVKGMDILGCQTLVCCGVLNRTVSDLAKKIFETDVSQLCHVDLRQDRTSSAPIRPPVSQSMSEGVDKATPAVPSDRFTVTGPTGTDTIASNPEGLARSQQASGDDNNDQVSTASTNTNSGVDQSQDSKKKKSPKIWVFLGVGLVAVLVLFVGCVVIAYRRQQKGAGARLINSAIVEHSEDRGPPVLDNIQVANSAPLDKIPQKMLAKGKPPAYVGPSISGIITSWDMPQVGNIRVIRELPMSEMAQSECDNLNTPGRAEAPVVFQLSGLEVHLHRLLGNGSHSSVYEGAYKRMDCAMKIIEHDRSMLEMHSEPMEDYLTKDLIHPNVVKLLATRTCELEVVRRWLQNLQPSDPGSGASSSCSDPLSLNLFRAALLPRLEQDDGNDDGDALNTFVVMEYCNGGTLAQALQNGQFFTVGKKPNISLVLMRAIDIAHALEHLHGNCVVHGDLKPANVLLHMTHKDSAGFVCKVVDFSMRRTLPPDALVQSMSLETMAHMPPELLSNGIISAATDVYSFGMILWGLVSGKTPFACRKRLELVRRVVAGERPPIPSVAPPEYAKLVEECWCPEPEKRPDFRTIVDRLRDIMFQYTGPGSRQGKNAGGAVNGVDRGVSDTAAKVCESSDTDSSRSEDDTDSDVRSSRLQTSDSRGRYNRAYGKDKVSEKRGAGHLRPQHSHDRQEISEANSSTRGSLPGEISEERRSVRFSHERNSADYMQQQNRQQNPRGLTSQPVHPTPQGGIPTFGNNGNWEYDGDCEGSTASRTLDSFSTFATLNEQISTTPGPLRHTPSGKSSTGWSVMSSGCSEDAISDVGVNSMGPHIMGVGPILENRR